MTFSIIIPNFNGKDFLNDCLKSLPKKQEIIIIDNGSTDNSLQLAKKLIPNIKIIKNNQNLGFAKAVNQGITAASNKYIALINNDLILSPNWFDQITNAINLDSSARVYTGLVLTRDGKFIESKGLKYFTYGKCLNVDNGLPYRQTRSHNPRPTVIWGANAAATTYHRQTLIDIGLFDEDFFAYEEDVDLSLRLSKLGYQTIYVPSAISYHLGGGTSSKMGNFRYRMDAKNWIYIIIKNYSSKDILTNFPSLFIERLRNLSGLIKNTPITQLIPSIISTYGQVIIKLPQILTKRRQFQKLLKSISARKENVLVG